ncbi:MAG: D-arabinose 5-phosphate isomerase [Bacteroidetes bacterium GWF2_33_16]|nr:MAG: D-arabinose 5-phosphate isomerase [Bacteroidetes bacterium GWE2_32_14]OFY05281.1 MAG: D-arabinose 5-phosphate isomerase [Bacteroidetes bacterium GWF2_33_16]
MDIIKLAKETILQEAESIKKLADYIDQDFEKVVKLIFKSKGRVIVTGIGKSANIANKIVATLNSTGTPAIFMHAADAIHGDLGIVQGDDIVICISKSGNTPEIKVLVPLIKSRGNALVGMVSSVDSFLGKNADYVLKSTIEKEACPNNLAPTSSTTAQLVIGDALAVCLLDYRGFSTEDFAKYHPGGALGKKLYMRVSDLYKNNEVPKVSLTENVRNVIIEISSKRLGATAVLTNSGDLAGIITDGDIRRMLQKNERIETLTAKDILSPNPKTIDKDELAINAFQLMENNNITQLVVTSKKKYVGIVHIHDILKEGIV